MILYQIRLDQIISDQIRLYCIILNYIVLHYITLNHFIFYCIISFYFYIMSCHFISSIISYRLTLSLLFVHVLFFDMQTATGTLVSLHMATLCSLASRTSLAVPWIQTEMPSQRLWTIEHDLWPWALLRTEWEPHTTSPVYATQPVNFLMAKLGLSLMSLD